MTPYVIRNKDLTPSDLEALRAVKNEVAHLPDQYNGEDLSCHVVARVVVRLCPGYHVVDGLFRTSYQHSWLENENAILDPYPVACAEPILVAKRALAPWCSLYRAVGEKLVTHVVWDDAKVEALVGMRRGGATDADRVAHQMLTGCTFSDELWAEMKASLKADGLPPLPREKLP